MKKILLLGSLAFAMMVGACGDDDDEEQTRSFIINKDNAVSVTRLAMRTAALTGRHSVIPKGTSTDPEDVRRCPGTNEADLISITPACSPDFPEAEVQCVFTETYECPLVDGEISNAVSMGTEQLSFTLTMDGYQEGSPEIGFIRYTGSISATTLPDGTTTYQDDIGVIARGAGDTEDTIASSTSGITTSTTSDTTLNFAGVSNLVTPEGDARLVFNDIVFSTDCQQSPVSGTIDMILIGLERAQLQVNGCGDVDLLHFVDGSLSNPEAFGDAELESAFASSVSDITTFLGVASNVEPAAEDILDERWCAPIMSAEQPVLATQVTQPTGFTLPATTNPLMECLSITGPAGSAQFANLILEDTSGAGTFTQPTQVAVHFFRAGAVALDTPAPGADTFIYSAYHATAETSSVALTDLDLDADGNPTGADLQAFCNPAVTDDTSMFYCWNRPTFQNRIDHFGLGLFNNTSAYWWVHILQ